MSQMWPHEHRHAAKVRKVARRFGVSLVEVPRGSPRADGATPSAGLDEENMIVFHDPLALGSHPAQVLHEVLHLVLIPPPEITGCSRKEALTFTPEEMLLLPFEQRVAQAMGGALRDRIIDWQGETTTWLLDIPGAVFCDVWDPASTQTWSRAEAIAVELGLVDSQGRPTWERPRWTKAIGDELRQAIDFVRGQLRRPQEGFRALTRP